MRLQNLSAVINLVQGLVFKAAGGSLHEVDRDQELSDIMRKIDMADMCKDGVVITMWNGRKYVVTVKEVK